MEQREKNLKKTTKAKRTGKGKERKVVINGERTNKETKRRESE